MNIWLVSTGSSDVQCNTRTQWNNLYRQVRSQFNNLNFQPSSVDEEERFTVPARVMGIVYGQQPDSNDLVFPLLDAFSQKLLDTDKKPEKIVVFLTDQEKIFTTNDKKLKKCPYWQDTCTLQPILEKFFQKKFPNAEQIYPTLKPEPENKGLDHWDSSLNLVQEILSNLNFDKFNDVYVSYQAGTPAISSAIQFLSIGRFGKKVKFLVSNEYQPNSIEIIDSSAYLRGIYIQQVKALITSGYPGAASKLIEVEEIDNVNQETMSQLQEEVNLFNLYSPNNNRNINYDFTIPKATQRIINSLDFISFFFKNKNYVQGIALVAAAQETLMKAVVCKKVNINQHVVTWKSSGLYLNDSISRESVEIKRQILWNVGFPKFSRNNAPIKLEVNDDFKLTNRNYVLLAWLGNLESSFQPWSLLEWSCKEKRDHDGDRRNQLLHNLRGMDDEGVIEYLLGYDDKNHTSSVIEAYENYVKQPFIAAIHLFNLPLPPSYQCDDLSHQLQEIANSIV